MRQLAQIHPDTRYCYRGPQLTSLFQAGGSDTRFQHRDVETHAIPMSDAVKFHRSWLAPSDQMVAACVSLVWIVHLPVSRKYKHRNWNLETWSKTTLAGIPLGAQINNASFSAAFAGFDQAVANAGMVRRLDSRRRRAARRLQIAVLHVDARHRFAAAVSVDLSLGNVENSNSGVA